MSATCCRVVISLKLSCSSSFEHQVEYDTELSHFTLVIIAVSAEELTFLYALSHFDFIYFHAYVLNKNYRILRINATAVYNCCRFPSENYNSNEIYYFEFQTLETS